MYARTRLKHGEKIYFGTQRQQRAAEQKPTLPSTFGVFFFSKFHCHFLTKWKQTAKSDTTLMFPIQCLLVDSDTYIRRTRWSARAQYFS